MGVTHRVARLSATSQADRWLRAVEDAGGARAAEGRPVLAGHRDGAADQEDERERRHGQGSTAWSMVLRVHALRMRAAAGFRAKHGGHHRSLLT